MTHQRLGRSEVLGVFIGWTVVALARYFESDAAGRTGYLWYLFLTTASWVLWTFLILTIAASLTPLRKHLVRNVIALAVLAQTIATLQDTIATVAWNSFVRTGRRRTETLHLLQHQFAEVWQAHPREMWIFGLVLGVGLLRVSHARIAAEEKRSAQLAGQVSKARLEAMRMQLNPHFFFNTLHAVSSYIDTDPERAQHLIVRMGDLMRATFSNAGRIETPLERELEFIDAYIDVMKARVGERLVLTVVVPTDLLSAMVPELILQPLVENSVKHGIEASSSASEITITAELRGSTLRIVVADDGPGLTSGVLGEGVGLQNVRERLDHLYGSAQKFTIENRAKGGVAATIELPFHRADDMYQVIGDQPST